MIDTSGSVGVRGRGVSQESPFPLQPRTYADKHAATRGSLATAGTSPLPSGHPEPSPIAGWGHDVVGVARHGRAVTFRSSAPPIGAVMGGQSGDGVGSVAPQIKRDGTPDGSAIFEEPQNVLDHPVGCRDGEVMVTVGDFCLDVGRHGGESLNCLLG